MGEPAAYISYAWGDDTPEGKEREAIVDDLCRSFAEVGIVIGRDKNDVKPGDSIEDYGKRIAKAPVILAVISQKSLRSKWCMLYELFEAYVRCGKNYSEFRERAVALVLEDAEADLKAQLPLIDFWNARAEEMNTVLKAADSGGEESMEALRVMNKCRAMIKALPDIILAINDIAMPRGGASIRRDDFGAIRKHVQEKLKKQISAVHEIPLRRVQDLPAVDQPLAQMNDLPLTPPPLGAMLKGVRYQLLHFWLHALPMLYPQGSTVASVEMECRDVKAVDDLKVTYHPPGISDGNTLVDVDYFQIKFHVSQDSCVSAKSLINPAWTGTKEPMLKRFWLAWKELRQHAQNPRLILRTNWQWDDSCPLAKRKVLREDGRLDRSFFTAKPATEVGEIFKSWQEACCVTNQEDFKAFLQALRFQTNTRYLYEIEDALRDKCRLAGAKVTPAAVDCNRYDDLGQRLLEQGRTFHTRETLRELLKRNNLLELESPPQNQSQDQASEETPLRSLVYVSYCNHDIKWHDQLKIMLAPLIHSGLDVWSDQQIKPGAHRANEIQTALSKAKVAVLLVSASYLASSDELLDNQLHSLLAEAERGGVVILWIPIDSSNVEYTDINQYEPLWNPSRPLAILSKPKQNKALAAISRDIAEAMKR
jgi:internalin A